MCKMHANVQDPTRVYDQSPSWENRRCLVREIAFSLSIHKAYSIINNILIPILYENPKFML